MSEEYLLQMTGIHKRFGGVHALNDVNFRVRPGKVMCLAGENGCGKSTLLKLYLLRLCMLLFAFLHLCHVRRRTFPGNAIDERHTEQN